MPHPTAMSGERIAATDILTYRMRYGFSSIAAIVMPHKLPSKLPMAIDAAIVIFLPSHISICAIAVFTWR